MKVEMSHILSSILVPVYGYAYLCNIATNSCPEHVVQVISKFMIDNEDMHLLYDHNGNVMISNNIPVSRHMEIAKMLKKYLEEEPVNIVVYRHSGNYNAEYKDLSNLYGGNVNIITEFAKDDMAGSAIAAINAHKDADVAAICINLGEVTLHNIAECVWVPLVRSVIENGSFNHFEMVR